MDLNLKNKILIILLLLTTATYCQSRDRVAFNIDGLYRGEYSEVLEQPLWVEYTVKCSTGKVERKGMNFIVPTDIKTSDDYDYIDNIYDKGHLAPAAAFACNEVSLRKTFSYLNSALQHQGLNRGQWSRLEAFERDLSNFYEVKVKIIVLFKSNSKKLPSGATIPSGFRKIIKFAGKVVVFEFPNMDTKGTNWIDYRK
jgi:endonuclease G